MKALVAVLVLAASSAHAYPTFVEPEETPAPLTRLGWRLAISQLPLDDNAVMGVGIALGVDHEVWGKLRVIGEYEWLWLTELPRELEMEPIARSGMGHRTHLGLRRAILTKRMDRIRFYLDAEAGAGLGIYDAPSGVEMLPHGFAGLRAGWGTLKRRANGSRTFETEISFRTIVVEHGLGFGGGLGFWWGD